MWLYTPMRQDLTPPATLGDIAKIGPRVPSHVRRATLKYRHLVLALLASLGVITYLDRVCVSIAGPRIQTEFGLGPEQWGWVTGGFAIAYAMFEIPSGYLADRFGARAMLLRIVLWWSFFTALTGMAHRLWVLIVVRFLFGAGEAGAYPTTATVVYRWFPPVERGRSFGVVLLSAQLGGAVAPLVIVPVQVHFGWRASFFAFGAVGAFWSAAWWRWYRNSPREMAGISALELAQIGTPDGAPTGSPEGIPKASQEGTPEGTAKSTAEDPRAHALPWLALASNKSVRAVMGTTFGYLYAYYFFLFWMPTFLMREHGFTENQTQLSALPFVLGILANFGGGLARDAATRRWGPTWGPRSVGLAGLGAAAGSVLAALTCRSGYGSLAWLALCYGGITFQQPAVFSTCVDIGREYSGAVAGCMNTAGALGGLLSSLVFGYLFQHVSAAAVLISMAVVLAGAAGLWLVTDATDLLVIQRGPASMRFSELEDAIK